jgi:hypothetical protein
VRQNWSGDASNALIIMLIEHDMDGWPCRDVIRHPGYDALWKQTEAELPPGWHILLTAVWDGRCFAGQLRVSPRLFRIVRPIRQTLSGIITNPEKSTEIREVLGAEARTSGCLPLDCWRKLQVYAAFTAPRLAWIDENWGAGTTPDFCSAEYGLHLPVRFPAV